MRDTDRFSMPMSEQAAANIDECAERLQMGDGRRNDVAGHEGGQQLLLRPPLRHCAAQPDGRWVGLLVNIGHNETGRLAHARENRDFAHLPLGQSQCAARPRHHTPRKVEIEQQVVQCGTADRAAFQYASLVLRTPQSLKRPQRLTDRGKCSIAALGQEIVVFHHNEPCLLRCSKSFQYMKRPGGNMPERTASRRKIQPLFRNDTELMENSLPLWYNIHTEKHKE